MGVVRRALTSADAGKQGTADNPSNKMKSASLYGALRALLPVTRIRAFIPLGHPRMASSPTPAPNSVPTACRPDKRRPRLFSRDSFAKPVSRGKRRGLGETCLFAAPYMSAHTFSANATGSSTGMPLTSSAWSSRSFAYSATFSPSPACWASHSLANTGCWALSSSTR